jgi:hypothetical protein
MREGRGEGAVGYANGIKVDLKYFKNVEFLWDVVAKVESPTHPDEDYDLTFVAESENQILIEKILEDANKLPIARADARLMFFRANDQTQREYFFRPVARVIRAPSEKRGRRRLHHGRHGNEKLDLRGAQAHAAPRSFQRQPVGRVLSGEALRVGLSVRQWRQLREHPQRFT